MVTDLPVPGFVPVQSVATPACCWARLLKEVDEGAGVAGAVGADEVGLEAVVDGRELDLGGGVGDDEAGRGPGGAAVTPPDWGAAVAVASGGGGRTPVVLVPVGGGGTTGGFGDGGDGVAAGVPFAGGLGGGGGFCAATAGGQGDCQCKGKNDHGGQPDAIVCVHVLLLFLWANRA